MKKRIVCAILSLILLVSIIPANALTASAASRKVSESAITVLKQLQKYVPKCSTKGYIGYGTKCTEKEVKGKTSHGGAKKGTKAHQISEKDADKALRAELDTIDKAVNGFASTNGLSLSQNQHDALVLFSFRNGTAWMSGTGDVKRAVTTRASGNEFVNMFLNWQSGDNNDRRKIEANMYLNGVYSSTVPSRYIQVTFDADGGVLPGNQKTFYYDYTISETELPTPTRDGYTFQGWYLSDNTWVNKMTRDCAGKTLTAKWQEENKKSEDKKFDPDKVSEYATEGEIDSARLASRVLYLEPNGKEDGTKVYGIVKVNGEYIDSKGVRWYRAVEAEKWTYKDSQGSGRFDRGYWVKSLNTTYNAYTLSSKMMISSKLYDAPNGNTVSGKVSGDLKVEMEYVDSNGIKWCLIYQAETYTHTVDKKDKEETNWTFNPKVWVKVGGNLSGGGTGASGLSMDVTVTVTNSYVNSRSYESIYAPKNGSYTQGTQLRIINTADADGFLWGQVAKSADDATPVAWVALMYTNYSDVVNKNTGSSDSGTKVIAKAVINLKGNAYVNVRSGAGTDNQIVGALTGNTMVDIYETKYVNGHEWGRCKQGWFLLAYADVTRLVDNSKNETSQIGFTSYAFGGTIYNTDYIFEGPSESEDLVDLAELEKDKKDSEKLKNGGRVTVTNITVDSAGNTWGKIAQGWIMIYKGDAVNNFDMYAAKFEVTADSASVRKGPDASYERIDTLSKGTEFDITKIKVTEDTIWGYSDKIVYHNEDGSEVNDGGRTYDGWVNLSSRYVKRKNIPSGISSGTETGSTGLVATVINVDQVNVRDSASIYGGLVCKLTMGTTCEVLDGPENGWYRLKIAGREDKETWVYNQYLDVKSGSGSNGSSSGSTGGNVETGKGIIANTYSGVNMRQTPGIAGAFMGKIQTGTSVEIVEVKQVGSSKWGKLTVGGKTGWVCMDYVTMISYEDIPGYSGGSSGTSGSGSSTVTGAQTAIYTGVVSAPSANSTDTVVDEFSVKGDVRADGRKKDSEELIVFKTTDINGAVVRLLNQGDPITMHELLTVEEEHVIPEDKFEEYEGNNYGDLSGTIKVTRYWARVNDGYIRAPGKNLILDALDEATYTLVDSDKAYVYTDSTLETVKEVEIEGDDFSGKESMNIKKGEKVTVTRVEIHGNVISGLVENETGEEGWINLSKLTKGSVNVKVDSGTNNNNSSNNNNNGSNNNNNTNTPVIGDTGNTGSGGFVNNAGGYKYTGKVINCNEVNVRSTASTSASKTAVLKSGASLVIYETTISEGMAWGRCDAGWVYLYYVDLTPATGSAIDARVVYNDNTIVYTDSACSETAGTYARMSVIDIYEIVGKMARTDLGWVNTDNLL